MTFSPCLALSFGCGGDNNTLKHPRHKITVNISFKKTSKQTNQKID